MSSIGESAGEFRRAVQAQEHQESLTPTGFRFFTNISVNAQTMTMNESWVHEPGMRIPEPTTFIEYIARIRNKYGDVQLTEAYSRSGELLGSPWNIWYAVYVKE
jgi:hypothetical protein